MRRSKWAAGLGLAVCLVLSLAGCGSKTQQSSEPIEGLDQLGDIQVIAREEGSGTRGHLHSLWDLKAMPERKPNRIKQHQMHRLQKMRKKLSRKWKQIPQQLDMSPGAL